MAPRRGRIAGGTRAACMAAVLAVAAMVATSCQREESASALPGVELTGTPGNQPGQFSRPRAVAVSDTGVIAVIDRSGRVQTFDLATLALRRTWRLPAWQNGTPTGMSIDRETQTLWVADTHYQRVLHYTLEGELLSMFGKSGTGPGGMIFPTDVTPSPDGRTLWITEYGQRNRLMQYTREGAFLREWAGEAFQADELLRPMSVVVDAAGRLLVADAGHHKINIYDSEGTLLGRFGQPGTEPGKLKYPYALALAPDGTLYVCEFGNSRISAFTLDGTFLGWFGAPGTAPGQLGAPWGIATGPNGELVIADTLNNRLQLLRDSRSLLHGS